MVRARSPAQGPGNVTVCHACCNKALVLLHGKEHGAVKRTRVTESGGSGFVCGLCKLSQVAFPL